MDALDQIKRQIQSANAYLRQYQPTTIDWSRRAEQTAESLIPWLIQIGPRMNSYIQDILNAPVAIRQTWQSIRPFVILPND